MSTDTVVKLQPSFGQMFDVDGSVVLELKKVTSMLEDTGMDERISPPNVTSKVLENPEFGIMPKDTLVKLQPSFGHMSEVNVSVAHESETVRSVMDDMGTEDKIPLPNVTSEILAKPDFGVMPRDTMVKLQSSDGQIFKVEESVAQELKMLSKIVDKDDPITLPNVESKMLAKVIEYASYHVEAGKSSDTKPAVLENEIKKWDADFVSVEYTMLAGLVMAAKYLDYAALLDLTTQAVADMIMGKTVEEIRKTFHIKNDFTHKEEEEARKENEWA